MKNFKFKLQTVLSYREKKEDTLKKELASLRAKYEKEKQILHALIEKLEEKQEELRAKQLQDLDIDEVSLYCTYLFKLRKDILLQAVKVEELFSQVCTKREELVEASKDKRIMEKLRDKQYEEFQQILLKSEQILIDEIATSRHKRKQIASLLEDVEYAE